MFRGCGAPTAEGTAFQSRGKGGTFGPECSEGPEQKSTPPLLPAERTTKHTTNTTNQGPDA